MLKLSEKIKKIPGEFALNQKLKSSLISQVFLCTFNNTNAVIRLDLPSASLLAIDRGTEAMLLESIQHLELAPKILYQDAAEGILIWEFIKGNELLLNAHNQESCLQLLGSALNAIHGSSIPNNCIDIFSESLHLYKNLLEYSSHQPLLQKTLSLYNELSADDITYVLSHNDLHKRNILWNKQCYFLDWEYAGLNHPCFDIASLVKTYKLNKNEFHALLIGYCGNKDFFDFKKINQWIVFSDLLDEVWEISINSLFENTFNKAN